MITSMQLVKIFRRKRRCRTYRKKILRNAPIKKAKLAANVKEITPRKPNSAKRKVAWIAVKMGPGIYKKTFAYLAGESWRIKENIGIGQGLRQHSTVFIRGGRIKDLPGLKYRLIHGYRGIKVRGNKLKQIENQPEIQDLSPLYYLRKKRSKYGIQKELNEHGECAKRYKSKLWKRQFKYF